MKWKEGGNAKGSSNRWATSSLTRQLPNLVENNFSIEEEKKNNKNPKSMGNDLNQWRKLGKEFLVSFFCYLSLHFEDGRGKWLLISRIRKCWWNPQNLSAVKIGKRSWKKRAEGGEGRKGGREKGGRRRRVRQHGRGGRRRWPNPRKTPAHGKPPQRRTKANGREKGNGWKAAKGKG